MYGKQNGIKRDKTPQQALDTARWLCSKMERTTVDIRRSLARWGVADTAIQDEILDTLVREKFIDHSRYAGAFVREKMSAGRWGLNKILYALQTKGIDRETANGAIAENYDQQSNIENLESDLRKRLEAEKKKAKNAYDLRSRLFRRAASRGYDFDHINNILNRILGDED